MWGSGKRASIVAFDRNALVLCILAPQNCFQTSWEVGGTCQTRVLCSFLKFHALKFCNYYLFIFQFLGLIFPPISNCIISACHFHILLLYIESPQIVASSLWCFFFVLVLWSHVWHIEIVSWSFLFLFFDICYLLLWLSTFTLWNGQIKCFSILFLPPLGSNCLVKISIKYFWQNHLMNGGFYSQKIWQTYLECIRIFFSFKAMSAHECHIFTQICKTYYEVHST